MADVLILTGPPAAGKTLAAQALAERYDRVAHIQVDQLRRMIAPTGYAKQGHPEYRRQRQLAVRNACSLALNFLAARFGVIIEDVLDDAEFATWYLEGLKDAGTAVHLVQLLPSYAACEAREAAQGDGRKPRPSLRRDYEAYVANAARLPGQRIDNSNLSPYETADRLQALTTSGASIVWRPPA